jgi:hypothetical protein
VSLRLRRLNATVAQSYGKQRLLMVQHGGHNPSLKDIHAAREQMAAHPDIPVWVVGHLPDLQVEQESMQASIPKTKVTPR